MSNAKRPAIDPGGGGASRCGSGDPGTLPGAPAPSPWPAVLCLIGLDYFSTLAYQPSMAFEAAGRVAPFGTIVVVLVTLFAALPVYAYVAGRSPDGHGSLGLLERWVRGWKGKTLILVLLGFIATDFVITKTISAADAAEHIIASPLWGRCLDALASLDDVLRPSFSPPFLRSVLDVWDRQLVVTVILLLLGFAFWAFFRLGFTRRVIQLAVFVVAAYLLLNAIVIGSGLWHLRTHPEVLQSWFNAVIRGDWGLRQPHAASQGTWAIALLCLVSFPSMALGLSGFELSMVVMPLVRGDEKDGDGEPPRFAGRVRNTRKLLLAAALVMSVYLVGSVLVTSTLIPPAALFEHGEANHRALAYLAHGGALDGGGSATDLNPIFGEVFGAVYDLSTIFILCLAGASVTIGLRDLVPRYLHRFGMELDWAHRTGAILHLFNLINLIVVVIFKASVDAQRGAYITSVVVLMSSAAIAALVDVGRTTTGFWRRLVLALPFSLASVVFVATSAVTLLTNLEGLLIAMWFVLAILVTSIISRTIRSTELRFEGFEFPDPASAALWERLKGIQFPVLVPHRPGRRSAASKEEDIRKIHRLGPEIPVVFVEAEMGDASDFLQRPLVDAKQEDGRIILRITRCASIAHVIAACGLELSKTEHPPEIHFGWSDESSITANINFLVFGEGNIPWLVRELIRRAEPDPERRPRVIIG